MAKVIYTLLALSFLLCHHANAQKHFGIYAENNSKNFKIVDYVIKGRLIQNGLLTDSLNVPIYSLLLSPGTSEQVGVGLYNSDPSISNPLVINASSDSTSSYVVLRNISQKQDSVKVSQRIGLVDGPYSTQNIKIDPGQIAKIYLPTVKSTFNSPLIVKKLDPFPGITLTIQ